MLRTTLCRPLIWLVITVVPMAAARGDTLTVGAQTGQQIFFNSTLTRTYNFGITSVGAGLTFDTVDVNLKGQANAPNNVFPALITIYGGLGGTGPVLATGSIAASSLTGQFAFRAVTLSSTLTLPDGGYSLQMTTSNVADYYLKDGALKLTGTSGTTLSSSLWVEDSNSTGTAGTSLVASGTVLATWATGTNAVRFGNYRVAADAFITSSISLTNTALTTSNSRTQALAATGTTVGNLTLTGLPSPYLSVGQTQDFTVGLSSGQTGPNTGTATLAFSSVSGTSATTGTTAVGTGTIAVSGTGYDWANAKYSGATLNFGNIHVGGTAAAQAVAIGNQTVTDAAYQDTLNVSGSTGNALVTATGFTGLTASAAGGTTQNLVVAVNSGSVGSLASAVALSLVSNANGVAGLLNGAATVVGTPGAITTVGQVYSGQSIWNTNGGGQWGTLTTDFGTNWQQYNGSPGLDAGFSDTDTATFGTAVTSGTATVTIASATASVRALTFANGAASYALTGSAGGTLVIRGGVTNATLDVTAGTHAIAAPLTFASNVAMDIATGSRLLVSGGASGTSGFIKTGGGILEIVSTNGYSGASVVDGGILKVNGTLSSSDVQIGVNAMLMGSGTIGGDLVVSGTHSPGNSPGIQTESANLTYQPNATVIWELIGNTTSGRGTNFDGIDVGGTLTFGAPTNLALAFNLPESTVNWADSFWSTSREGTNGWLVYSVAGEEAEQLVGFGNLTLTGQNGADASGNLLQNVRPGASFATYQDGNDVYLTYTYVAAVPEPGTLASLAAAGVCLLGLAALRRRRR